MNLAFFLDLPNSLHFSKLIPVLLPISVPLQVGSVLAIVFHSSSSIVSAEEFAAPESNVRQTIKSNARDNDLSMITPLTVSFLSCYKRFYGFSILQSKIADY